MKKSKILAAVLCVIMLVLALPACKNNANISMPDQKYVGTWYNTDRLEQDSTNVLQIEQINNETIVFNMAMYRSLAFNATAKIENNKLKFVSGDDSANVTGTMRFNENSIELTLEETDFYDDTVVGKTFAFEQQ